MRVMMLAGVIGGCAGAYAAEPSAESGTPLPFAVPPRQPDVEPEPEPTIKRKYDKFTDATLAWIGPFKIAPFITLRGYIYHPGEKSANAIGEIRLSFTSNFSTWNFLRMTPVPLFVLADGRRLEARTSHRGEVGSFSVLEYMDTEISVEQLQRIATSETVECRLGHIEFKLSSEVKSAMRELIIATDPKKQSQPSVSSAAPTTVPAMVPAQ